MMPNSSSVMPTKRSVSQNILFIMPQETQSLVFNESKFQKLALSSSETSAYYNSWCYSTGAPQ